MTQRIEREIQDLRRAGQRLETVSKEWDAAYREYAAALDVLNSKAEGPSPNGMTPPARPRGLIR
jgi:hypothetical protein